MSVYFLGDPHLGDPGVVRWRELVGSVQANTDFILKQWRKTITKRDIVYVMGDVAHDKAHLELFGDLPGRKILIRGNHDDVFTAQELLVHFEEIHSMLKYKGMWITHCPIHPQELFGKVNLHGHTHQNSVLRNGELDDRYINACIEVVWPRKWSIFLPLEDAKEMSARCPMVIQHKAMKDRQRQERMIGLNCISGLFDQTKKAAA